MFEYASQCRFYQAFSDKDVLNIRRSEDACIKLVDWHIRFGLQVNWKLLDQPKIFGLFLFVEQRITSNFLHDDGKIEVATEILASFHYIQWILNAQRFHVVYL